MEKGFVGLVFIILIAGCVQYSNQDNQTIADNQSNETIIKNILPEQTNKTQEKLESDAIDAYPINCYPQLGFDNYRTEQAFVINPKNNSEMYISVEYKGLYKSVDKGKTWTFSGKGIKATPRSDDPSKPCYELHFSIYIDPSNPQRILFPGGGAPSKVGMGVGGLAESFDSGKTWHQLFTSEMSAYTENAITDPRDAKIIYVTTAALPQGMSGPDQGRFFVTKGIVYKTIDGGKTWEELPTGIYEHLRVTGIFIDSKNPDHLLVATFGLPPGSNVNKSATSEQWGFLETKDAGKTWTKFSPTIGIGIRYVDVSPTNLDHYFMLASKDNIDKVFYSVDGKNLNELNSMVNFARYDPHDKTGMRLIGLNLYAQPDDIFESIDGGKTWNPVGKLPNGVTNTNRVSNIVFDPIDENVIYLNSDMARVWKSADKGKTWELLLSIEKLS